MNTVISNIKDRRSIRKYMGKGIPDEVVKEIVEAGRYAPSSHNSQPWRFIVITNKEKVKELSLSIKSWYEKIMRFGTFFSILNKKLKKVVESAKQRVLTDKDLFFYEAPLVILICSKKGRFSDVDCACAAENMMLAARSLGIGSCWIGFADAAFNKNRGLRESIGVSEGHYVAATLIFGYPLKFPEKAYPRKEESDIVKWIK